jgi:hypothetical protein
MVTNWVKNRRQKAMPTVSLSKLLIRSWSISAGSLTPMKRFQHGHWPSGNLYDPAGISNCSGSQLFFKREYPAKIFFMSILYIYLLKEVCELLTSFVVSSGLMTPRKPILSTLASNISAYTKHMRNSCSPFIRDLFGVNWWKNQESKIWFNCAFNLNNCISIDFFQSFHTLYKTGEKKPI